ncbi:MAG: CoA transferase, partial [Candidatus Accumulibacter sp.]|nr:CoA transferase [Accumulibacter sp.]
MERKKPACAGFFLFCCGTELTSWQRPWWRRQQHQRPWQRPWRRRQRHQPRHWLPLRLRPAWQRRRPAWQLRRQGQQPERRLIATADVVIENFRPGSMEKWGLAYERLSADNPALIMARVSGFGQT